jgi:hypothetical protein
MKKAALLAAASCALVAASVFADDLATTTPRARSADACAALFTRLDTGGDGRISSAQAATDAGVASGFDSTTLKDRGDLSKVDFDAPCRGTDT